MEYAEWESVYGAILDDFGYDRSADERARDVLADLVCGSDGTVPSPADAPGAPTFDEAQLSTFDGATVAIAGAGPSLVDGLDRARSADVVVAASSAAAVCDDAGVAVDCVVTDLDGTPATAVERSHDGVPVAVHAHGDNVPLLREWVPRFASGQLLPTTQAAPKGPVRNFGGFTDGDRAAFLADHFGAGELRFVGWDFDDPGVDDVKRRKLRWAERLLYWLERRRGERFDVLDGRRDGIDASELPP